MSEPVELRVRREVRSEVWREGRDGREGPSDSTDSLRFVTGVSEVMHALSARIGAVAAADCSVLITGETGTGKGALARLLHDRSQRASSPFVHVDCAALSATLIESELFGHERGAFTGAHRSRPGRFELAGCGTIFLDEIAELDVALQAKLLRVLQDRVYERAGGSQSRRMGARVLAATNRALAAAVADGSFRADLMYRLAVVELRLPPLRDRAADVGALVREARRVSARRGAAVPPELEPAALAALERHRWPGNVRELLNVLERLALFSGKALASASDVVEAIGGQGAEGVAPDDALPGAPQRHSPLERIVAECQGNVAMAARQLGLPRSTLRYRLARRAAAARESQQLSLPGLESARVSFP